MQLIKLQLDYNLLLIGFFKFNFCENVFFFFFSFFFFGTVDGSIARRREPVTGQARPNFGRLFVISWLH